MDPTLRAAYNRVYSDELFARYHRYLESWCGPFPFRLTETPLFISPELRAQVGAAAEEIVTQLAQPAVMKELTKAIPPSYDVPRMDALPHCVQVDFALVRSAAGAIEGRLIELQAFPSLYALESVMADAWSGVLSPHPGLEGPWTCFFEGSRERNLDLVRKIILDGNDPEEVAMVDFEPERQKTYPDFAATKRLFGVNAVCVTRLIREGQKLYRDSGGRKIPVKRIYNRMVFDELEVKGVKPPFAWNDDLDVTWCSHPNWYWVWSKYSIPFLNHPAVPRTRYVSQLEAIPEDLDRYVLKPLFSFAGAGVVVDVTREIIDAIPATDRDRWILQEKVEYASAITMPTGEGVKAEVRVMVMRASLDGPRPLVPYLCLVRTSRGKMLGVDFNKGHTWVGGTVGLWRGV